MGNKERKREREILHSYLEWLGEHFDEIEPREMSGSISEIYDSLKGGAMNRSFFIFALFAYSFISILIHVINLFWCKTR